MVQWLSSYLDGLGVECIDFNVRKDSFQALAFWEAYTETPCWLRPGLPSSSARPFDFPAERPGMLKAI